MTFKCSLQNICELCTYRLLIYKHFLKKKLFWYYLRMLRVVHLSNLNVFEIGLWLTWMVSLLVDKSNNRKTIFAVHKKQFYLGESKTHCGSD